MKKLILILLVCAAAPAAIFINSFNSGQLSKDLKFRQDLEQTMMGSETLQNIMVRPQGMAYKRPGTEYITAAQTKVWNPGTPEVISDYPVLRAATPQADPELLHETPISNITEFQAIKDDVNGVSGVVDGHYYLTQDIDASATSTWNGGAGFLPIGLNTSYTHFQGTLDGCGYTISNLYQDATVTRDPYPGPTGDLIDAQHMGIFDWIGNPDCKVANLTITNANFTGWAGGILAYQLGSGTTVYNVHVSGTINMKPMDYAAYLIDDVGGMVGHTGLSSVNAGTFYDCTTDVEIVPVLTPDASIVGNIGGFIGDITGRTYCYNCKTYGDIDATGFAVNSNYIGGFIGRMPSTYTIIVQDCNAFGDVSGDNYVGGFFGGNAKSVQRCYAGGNVTGTGDRVGGFVGSTSAGNYTDCYAWGNATGDQYVGGFGGYWTSGTPNQVYSIGVITGNTDVGGLVGHNVSGSSTTAYWDTDTSGQAASDLGTGNTTTWLKTKTNYPAAWDFDTIWYMPDYVPPTEGYWETISGLINTIRLLPFEYAANDAYVLEFGHRYISFLRTVP